MSEDGVGQDEQSPEQPEPTFMDFLSEAEKLDRVDAWNAMEYWQKLFKERGGRPEMSDDEFDKIMNREERRKMVQTRAVFERYESLGEARMQQATIGPHMTKVKVVLGQDRIETVPTRDPRYVLEKFRRVITSEDGALNRLTYEMSQATSSDEYLEMMIGENGAQADLLRDFLDLSEIFKKAIFEPRFYEDGHEMKQARLLLDHDILGHLAGGITTNITNVFNQLVMGTFELEEMDNLRQRLEIEIREQFRAFEDFLEVMTDLTEGRELDPNMIFATFPAIDNDTLNVKSKFMTVREGTPIRSMNEFAIIRTLILNASKVADCEAIVLDLTRDERGRLVATIFDDAPSSSITLADGVTYYNYEWSDVRKTYPIDSPENRLPLDNIGGEADSDRGIFRVPVEKEARAYLDEGIQNPDRVYNDVKRGLNLSARILGQNHGSQDVLEFIDGSTITFNVSVGGEQRSVKRTMKGIKVTI